MNQIGAGQIGQINEIKRDTEIGNCIDTVFRLNERLMRVKADLWRLNDRLHGPQPCGTQEDCNVPSTDSALGKLNQALSGYEEILISIESVSEELSRLA